MRPEGRRIAVGAPGGRPAALAAAAAVALALTACTALTLPREQPVPAQSPPAIDRNVTQAALLADYLEVLQRLVQGAPAEQAEILSAAQRDFETAPTPSHQLRYALVLSTPDHPGADPVKAQQLLRELVAMQETLLPAERALAFLQLQTVEHTLALRAENQHLQGLADRTDEHDKYLAASRRLQAETDENALLRKELDESRAKLDAIANIERALSKPKPRPQGSAP